MSKTFDIGRLKHLLLFEFPEHKDKEKIRRIFHLFESDSMVNYDNDKVFTEDERLDMYYKVYHLFGDNQIVVAIEEMSELTQLLAHAIRKDREVTYDDLASEIADVRIMIDQLINIFSIYDLVIKYEKKKLARLSNYLREIGYGREDETD